MDHPLSHAFSLENASFEDDSSSLGLSPDVQSLLYQSMPLCKLPQEKAIAFCRKLYSPEERFALSFYRYHKDIINLPEKEAWQATLDELNEYVDRLIENLNDPRYHTIGYELPEGYLPVGLYGFRALNDHEAGRKLFDSMTVNGVIDRYHGNLAIAHSFSALNGYRNRALMKYAFLMIALEALEQGFQHIFFFMSDYRLGSVYKRVGMDFPPDLTFSDSKHLVGCYSITSEHLKDIKETADQYDHRLPASLLQLFSSVE